MAKVALTLTSPYHPADELERVLDALRAIIALITSAEVHTEIIEE